MTGFPAARQFDKTAIGGPKEIRRNDVSDAHLQWLDSVGLKTESLAPWIEPLPEAGELKLHLYHCDHLGTPVALINHKTGKVEWDAISDVWGNAVDIFNPYKLRQPIRMQGQHVDEESGLHYNRHRYYDPALGRYITQDPIGPRGGWNLYGYVYSKPNELIDPLGLDIWIEGASLDEPELHQSVNIGDPNAEYDSYSYGMDDFPYGNVYKDTEHGGSIDFYKKTTKEQDESFKKGMDDKIGKSKNSIYGYDDICRSWSQREFKRAPGVEAKNIPQRPNIKNTIGFSGSSSRGVSTTSKSGTSK
ncbi:RHS repeat-associated core domain-containing protein [Rahnella laticis]|uniref:RHS repeat-associated core domain-containing protein n=1 Tax=Rahnella laticis TaxID=2787622 RepID=UPI001E4E0BD1|nr:RHS repeat-associated core domain-containing protein [Rahnella laticis]